MDNLKVMIDEIFEKEPDSMVVVTENKNPIAIVYKEDWKGDKFIHVKAKCSNYIPPAFIKRSDTPIIGTVLYIELNKCVQR